MAAPGRVLISGAASGIGRACTVHMARAGFAVFAGVRRDEDLEPVRRDFARECGPAARRVHVLPLDVADPASIDEALREVARLLEGRGLNGLVNNAGIVVACPLEFLAPEEFQRQVDVNLRGPFLMTRAALPLLREARAAGAPARIVMMSSVASGRVLPLFGPYSATKSGLEALAHALRLELRPWGIQVSIVEPGAVRTPLWEKSVESFDARFAHLSEMARGLYREHRDFVRQAVLRCSDGGQQPEEIAVSVCHALTASRARTRYRAGVGPVLMPLWNMLPTGLTDLLTLSWLGLRP